MTEPPSPSYTPGRVLKDTYRIDTLLAEGGMSLVYRGWDLLMEAPVALKLFRPSAHPALELKRFLREARTQAPLIHPNIVTIRAILRDGDDWFLVMEYVRGEDIGSLIHRNQHRPLYPWRELVGLFDQVLQGMEYAHRRGVVHRDLKPSNLILSQDGFVKVADFGIAREIRGQKLTQTGLIVGTPSYMSPEQLRGLELDHRTDIYSLGVSLYEMLCGRTPFEDPESPSRDVFELMQRHILQPPPSPREFGAEIPAALEEALLRALAKQPEDRFQSCEDFRLALLQSIGSEPARSPLEISPSPLPSLTFQSLPSVALEQEAASLLVELGQRTTGAGRVTDARTTTQTRKAVREQSAVFEPPAQPPAPEPDSTVEFLETVGLPGLEQERKRKGRRISPLALGLGALGVGLIVIALSTFLLLRGRLRNTGQEKLPSPTGGAARSLSQPTGTPGPPPRIADRPVRRVLPAVRVRQAPDAAVSSPPEKSLAERRAKEGKPARSAGAPPQRPSPTSPPRRVAAKERWPIVRPTLPQPPLPVPLRARQKKRSRPPRSVRWRSALVRIRSGCFVQGAGKGKSPHSPRRRVCLREFWLDRTEVTVRHYRRCVRAGRCRRLFRQEFFRRVDKLQQQKGHQPVRWVTWEEARKFCRWAGKRLPTEAEWERGARGRRGRRYPWGARKPTCRRAYFKKCWSWKPSYKSRPRSRRRGRSPYGLYDMAGGVAEWVQDCYGRTAYRTLPRNNPRNLRKGCWARVIRGGSSRSSSYGLRAYLRNRAAVRTRRDDLGFRCAWSAR